MAGMKKPKVMYKPYDENSVPDTMPLPGLSSVATTKGQETPIPKLNDHQRSWILDIGICGLDLLSLTGKAAVEAYDKVKTETFAAKAFQHTPGPDDATDKACIATFIANWKQAQKDKKKKNTNSLESDSDESDQEEDDNARGALLRTYP
ncbi:hypothetical protein B0H17DRAFT_1200027 [Mycena rosella]|uniref:Uncharacterized protein n=1 Tax=Mycena rosella TaxID=1033263 RepID=A0AAD7DLU9_MYCRO|nr:hypothetical protein B0H17DRAFT_1200027 [Mycena rosella]